MKTDYDLANIPEQLPNFCRDVSKLAWIAWDTRGKTQPTRRTGEEICGLLCINWRGFHRRVATTIYTRTLDSFRYAEGERHR